MDKKVGELHKLLDSATRVGIFSHINPDGDALGSSTALASFIEAMGKKAKIFLPSIISESLRFVVDGRTDVMEYDISQQKAIAGKIKGCDLLIGIDFNNLDRIGPLKPMFQGSKVKKVLIDHHLNPEKSSFDLVFSKTEVSSACELLYSILLKMPDIKRNTSRLPEKTRFGLMTGMTTDTNNFANSVYPSTLKMTSELLAAGTDRNAIIRELYFSYPLRRIKAQGYILDKVMKVLPCGAAYIFIDKKLQHKLDIREGDIEGFVNIPLSIDSVCVSVMAKEDLVEKKIRISIRSKEGTSANRMAGLYFHGGGHELASGGRIILGEDIAKASEAPAYIEKCIKDFMKK